MLSTLAARCSAPTVSWVSSSKFAPGGLLGGFAEFLRAAGQRPGADVRRLAAADQQDLGAAAFARAQNHDADADERA